MFCPKSSISKMEKIQHRALRYVFDDKTSTYEVLLKQANIHNLAISRLQYLAIEVFKCLHKLNPSYLCNLFKLREIQYNFRATNKLVQHPYNSVSYGSKFPSFRV